MIMPDGRVESCGNFHGAPLGLACDSLAVAAAEVGAIAERRTDRLLDPSRSHGLPPFLAEQAGVNSRADDRPLHAGGDRRREPPPRRPGERRFASDQRDAGGPRLDGMGRGAQAAPRRRQPLPHPRGRAELRGPRPRPARAARARRRDRRGDRGAAGPRSRARAATAGSLPSSPRPTSWSAAGRSSRPSRARSESWRERPARGARPARHRALLPRLAAGGRAADADEQPRSRGRRGSRPARRLRRHRARRRASWEAFEAIVRTLRDLDDDESLLVQSGKPVGVFRTHERAPRVLIANSNLVGRVGDLGRVPPARGARADHVRADDRRLVDLHRQPGDRPGHL